MASVKRFFFAGALLLLAASFLQAATPERKDAVFVGYSSTGLTTSTSVVVVDLSDTVNFPHKQSGGVAIVGARVDIVKTTTSSGTLKIGVVSRVDATNGDVTWFYTKDFSKDATSAELTELLSLPESFIRTRVENRATKYLAANDKTTNSTTFQTDVALPTFAGNAAPGVGDIVAQLTNLASGAIDFTVQLLYDTER